jgi:transposase
VRVLVFSPNEGSILFLCSNGINSNSALSRSRVRLLAELGHELWIGDSAKIRASEVRKQKTDERDAALILDLLLAKRFPRIWVPTPAECDLRQLLWHGHKLVRLRAMLGNQLHFLAWCRIPAVFRVRFRFRT